MDRLTHSIFAFLYDGVSWFHLTVVLIIIKTDCDTLHVYEHDMELQILSFCYIISVFHCKAIGSFLELHVRSDTHSEFRWISLVDILDFKKHSWIKF